MNNFFLNEKDIQIKEKYDIKGSLYKRKLPEEKIKLGEAMKDENFIEKNIKIQISKMQARKLLSQVQKDAEFLASQHVMDYSMLVGIVDNREYEERFSFGRRSQPIGESSLSIIGPHRSELNISKTMKYNMKDKLLEINDKSMKSTDGTKRYFLGIIDTLTKFNWIKKGEYLYKHSFVSKKISCIPPFEYHFRFYEFFRDSVEFNEDEYKINKSESFIKSIGFD